MIGKKRGMLLLLLVIALLVFSINTLALEEASKIAEIYVKFNDCYGCNHEDKTATIRPSLSEVGCEIPPEKGCSLRIFDDPSNWGCTEDKACIGIEEGTILTQQNTHETFNGKKVSGSHNDDTDNIWCKNVKSGDNNQYVCSGDGWWKVCDEYGAETGVVTWLSDGTIYECIIDDDLLYPVWKSVGTDTDHDNFTSPNDCDDDTTQDPPNCPTNLEDEKCLYPDHSECAICINPGAPETCGDGVDNDCNGIAETCDDFREGCSQLAIPVDNLVDGAWADTHGNIYGTSFPWVKTEEGGFCCGFNGLADLGKIVTGISDTSGGDSGEFVCLSKNPDLTGGEVEIPGEDGVYCRGDSGNEWCLSNAVGGPAGGGKYTIFTVKPLGESPYDIVSNGQSWLTCNKTSVGWLQDYPQIGIDDEFDSAVVQTFINRFYCYDEGDHYAWAECANVFKDRKNQGVKGRYPGDGLYSLPLSKTELEGGIKVSPSGVHRVDINVFNNYQDFYGKNHLLDFSDYKYLNFMVQFCDKDGDCTEEDVLSLEELQAGDYLPLNIELYLLGEGDVVLFNKSVLGDVTNSPQFDPEVWLHVKTEIPNNMKGIRNIWFDTAPPARMRIRNVYLSKDEPETLLCSGMDAQGESSWLTDMDQGSSKEDITGEDLCKALYGPNSWLGKDSQIDNTIQYANCCGDDPNEYYAGPSMGEEENRFGCWNSETIKDKETSTNVEFEVEYVEEEINFTYPSLNVDVNITITSLISETMNYNVKPGHADEDNFYACPDLDCATFGLEDDCENTNYAGAIEPCVKNSVIEIKFPFTSEIARVCNFNIHKTKTNSELCNQNFGQEECNNLTTQFSFKFLCNQTVIVVNDGGEIPSTEMQGQYYVRDLEKTFKISGKNISKSINKNISYQLQGEIIDSFNISTNEFINPLNGDGFGGISIENNNKKTEIQLFNSLTGELSNELSFNDFLRGKQEIHVIAGPSEDYAPTTTSQQNLKNKSYSYSCSDKECLYPLPGEPSKPRTIKNSHPELYDLYFVSYNNNEEKIEYELINGEATFSKPGNVMARKVSEQVMFIADDLDSTFYGCQAADYILDNNKVKPFLEDQPYCSIQGDQFCSPSVRVSALSGQDQYTLVNSWSSEEVSKVGYLDEAEESTFDDFETYFDSLILQLKDPNTIIEAKDRNYTTSVVPFRNIIPNAEFENSGGEIPHWEILKNDKVVDSEKGYWEEGSKEKIKLKSNEILRSEKIAINQSGTYYISNNGTVDINIYNDKGKKVIINNDGTFEPNSQFIIVTFSKGTVYQPFLQLVDDFGPGEYNYKYQTYPDEYYFRSGLSCCKPNQCWNGYTCVEPMENVALMTEHFGLGKDYRCIDGQWTHLPVKWDWNNQKWGFCTQEEQCFVTKKGLAGNTISSFLDQGKAPICINPGESVLDHYCQDGAWTSRTKFLASKLVEVAGNDEFILYCTHYEDALLDYGNEIYLGGESQEESDELPGLGEESVGIAQDSELSYTCFPDLWGAEDSKDLVAQDENTCINNMCVLRYTEGGKFKTAFATTLNKNISDTANSFLLGFNVPQEELNTICAGEDDFVKCAFDGADMWYSEELNAIVYSKQGISLSQGLGEQVLDWLKDLVGIGTDLPEFEQFVVKASNFNEIYLLDKDGKKAKVVREFVNGSDVQQQSILAEYEGFSTPVCEYVDNLALPEKLQTELLLTVEGYSKYNCTSEAGKQKLQIIVNQDDHKGLDYFWPQLTGKLRVGSFD